MPIENSQINPPPIWTEQEKWVWGKLSKGEIADFTTKEAKEGLGIRTDDSQKWSETTVLSPAFLQTILLNDPYREALPWSGVKIIGAWIKEPLFLEDAVFGRPWWMNKCRFEKEVVLSGLRTPWSISLKGSIFSAALSLLNAKVGGTLNMGGSTFTGPLNMNSLKVGQSLLMREGAQFVEVDLTAASVGKQLDISGSQLFSLNMTGTKIRGEFSLDPSPKWQPGANLILRNVEVGALRDRQDAWPEVLDLNGFTYAQLGVLDLKGENPIPDWKVSWFCRWLEKQPSYSPQPYQQLAKLLLKSGYRTESDEILYIGRERERKSVHGWVRAWMTLLKWTIGYGYRTWMALLWALLVVVLGAIILNYFSNQTYVKGILDEGFYSLAMFLPGIQLDERYSKIELDGWVTYYFYIQKIIGVVLGSFLVAGLSGLTKK